MLAELGRRGVSRVATVVEGGAPYDRADLAGPVAIVLGSEAHGLARAVLTLVDQPVSIPMAGRSESLQRRDGGVRAVLRVPAPAAVGRASGTDWAIPPA